MMLNIVNEPLCFQLFPCEKRVAFLMTFIIGVKLILYES